MISEATTIAGDGRTPGAAAAVLGAAVAWGTVGAAQELGVPTASPAGVAAVRSLAGGLLLLGAVLLARRGPQVRAVLTRAPGHTVGAVVSITLFQVWYLGGIRTGGVAVGALLAIGSVPAFTGVASALLGRPPGRRWILATLATVAGAALLLLGGGSGGASPLGAALSLAAGASFAAYTLLTKGLLARGLVGTPMMAVVFCGSGLLLAPVLVVTDTSWVTTPAGLLTTAWLAVVTTLVGYRLFARGLAGVDAPTATTLTLAEPLTAALLGVLLLGERLTGGPLVGAALVVAGLVVTARGAGRARVAGRGGAGERRGPGVAGEGRGGRVGGPVS